ncbi:MAG: hypothetical protein LBS24_05405 [Clostridiales Family XIII bacterium]|jgi:hypothetical protein|nr:hypothetical protein [Clostridiales Family XIII bacterium]
MKMKMKKTAALFVSLVLLLGLAAISAYAAEDAYPDPVYTLDDGTVLTPQERGFFVGNLILVPEGVDTLHMRVDPSLKVLRFYYGEERHAPDRPGGGDYTLTANSAKLTGDNLQMLLTEFAKEEQMIRGIKSGKKPERAPDYDLSRYMTGDYSIVSIREESKSDQDAGLFGAIICWQLDLPALTSLEVEGADFYTPFASGDQIQRFVLKQGASEATLRFTATPNLKRAYLEDADGKTVAADGIARKGGVYSFTLRGEDPVRRLILENEKGNKQVITFYGEPRKLGGLPDAVVDYLCLGSQYSDGGNRLTGIYGLYPEKALIGNGSWSTPISLGNFGGYITFYYGDAIRDDPGNPYGVDLIVFGNSNGGAGFSEPGNVSVSEDGKTWYALAGSEHYEDFTLWDFEVVYERDAYGYTVANGVNIKPHMYPSPENYPLHDFAPGEEERVAVRGVMPFGRKDNGMTYGSSMFPPFGYADVKTNRDMSWGTGEVNELLARAKNPYLPATKQETGLTAPSDLDEVYEGGGDGFDLAWAVDADGRPVALGDIHYVKVSTASFGTATGGTGEKSTEVNAVVRIEGDEAPVGASAAPASISVGDTELPLEEGVFEYAVSAKGGFSVRVDAPAGSNVYINNLRAAERYFALAPAKELIRVIVQNGEQEPLIYYIAVKGEALAASDIAAVIAARSGGEGGTDAIMTRETAVAALYELAAGDPRPYRYNRGWPFPKYPEGAENRDALEWGLSVGVISHVDGGFGGESGVTREQLAVMLYRLAFVLGRETPPGDGLEGFGDAEKVSAWARDAADWAFGSGLLAPGANGGADPAGLMTESEAADILQRFFALMLQRR